jgi:two-component system OmpR family sensor kinase
MRRTLIGRAVFVTCAVALLSVLVTALAGAPLANRASQQQARQTLSTEADIAAELLAGRARPAGDEVVATALRRRGINLFLVRNGTVDRAGLPPGIANSVARGTTITGRTIRIGGRLYWAEGRPLSAGSGVVLVRQVHRLTLRQLVNQLWFPLLAGLAAGVLAGVLLAGRLARPIRNAASAAARLSAGDRSVRVPVEQPAEVAELALALNGLTAALAQSEGRQRDFLMSISHELRTPLTTIKGYAEALADGVVSPEGAPKAGQTLLGEAERLDRLVSDLLVLARLEADDFPIELMRVDLAGLVGSAAEAWASRCREAGVMLRTQLAPATGRADPGRLRQVVDGLVENALRVLPTGAPLVLAAYGNTVEIRDGGPGLADDDLAVAFERGALHHRYRGRRAVGSGLGLALAGRLIQRIGGTIEAGHAPEGGARFTIHLPPDQTRTSH